MVHVSICVTNVYMIYIYMTMYLPMSDSNIRNIISW